MPMHKPEMPVALIAALLLAISCDDDEERQVIDAGTSADSGIGQVPDAGPGLDAADEAPAATGYEARFLIEHNASDDDTGFQLFFDWHPWATLSVTGPGGEILSVNALGALTNHGLTEMFFETNEPGADELPRAQVLALFPAGDYTFDVMSTDGETLQVKATLTHDIPKAVQILAPTEGAMASSEQPLVVSWTPGSGSLEGKPIDITAYRVIVGRDLELPASHGFAQLVFDATVPPDVTKLPVPAEYLRPGTPYQIEVLAIASGGNQTIASSTFKTTGTAIDDLDEAPRPGPMELAASKFLIEHNATDQDTGYQIFVDGEAWSSASLATPEGTGVVAVKSQGNLATLGLTEMFFESHEPPADEVPLAEILSLFPEGDYHALADAAGGESITMAGTAVLSHEIPQGPMIAMPAEDAAVDPAAPLVVSWSAVSKTLNGVALGLVGYQVVVVVDRDAAPAAGFFLPTYSVHLPADTTSVTVPSEFLETGTSYRIEVLALEKTGNQTISLLNFQTR